MSRKTNVLFSANTPYITPPTWAILERKLIDAMNDSVEPLLEKYVRKDGSLLWPTTENFQSIDGLDDAYESFHNWPLFYALGGDAKFRDLSLFEWEAITLQFTKYDCGHGHPMVVKEYEQGYDWFHQAEGYLFFYMLGLADPGHAKNKERAQRFAGFYLNEDPQAPNYDEVLKLVRCTHVGSMGPAYRNFTNDPWDYADWKKHYGLPYQDVPGFTSMDSMHDRQAALNMASAMKDRMSRGDVPANLAIAGMLTQAYLFTGDEKYRNWIVDYTRAWMKRITDNNGIIPDNIGLSGMIGETMNGKWYGGNYGWTWPHGWGNLGDAVMLAAEDAMLLTRETSHLDLARSQMDMLISHAIEAKGTLYIPHKYGDAGCYEYGTWSENMLAEDWGEDIKPKHNHILWKDGWFEFMPMKSSHPVHLWFMSRSAEDKERIKKIRNNYKLDWQKVTETREKDQGGHEAAWAAYLFGEYPGYPEDILRYNLTQVERRLELIQNDQQDPLTYGDYYLQQRNPITLEGLTQLTLGGPLPLYNGGHLMSSVRYFDRELNRPGLPQDVAALVEKIDPETIVIQLVNLSPTSLRELTLVSGAYGEHEFTTIREMLEGDSGDNSRVQTINARYFDLDLLPASSIRLEIGIRRFVNDPRHAFPWDV